MIDALGSAATFSFTNYLDLGGTVLILWYGGTLAMDKRITVGTLVAFRLYWSMINSSYKSLMTVLSSFTRAGGAAQRVLSLMDACPDIDPDAGERLNEIKGDITLDKVEFYYQLRPEQQVLKGVDLEVKAGQVCALVGRSGGGKSTLVHLMMRFYDPTAGRVCSTKRQPLCRRPELTRYRRTIARFFCPAGVTLKRLCVGRPHTGAGRRPRFGRA